MNKLNFTRNLSSKTGVTLTELLVAVILVGIIMVGTVSIDYAMRSTKKSTSEYTQMVMRAQTAMKLVSKDALLAVGEGSNPSNPDKLGVHTDISGEFYVAYFRHDTDNDPTDYSGDEWIRYKHGDSNDIYRCTGLGTWNSSYSSSCAALGGVQDPAYPIIHLENPGFINIVTNGSNQMEYIEISLDTILDGSKSYHPINNPRYSLKTRISPVGISR